MSEMRAAITVPAKPSQTCTLTPELLADPTSALPGREPSRPTRSFSLAQSCKAVPSSAPETNSNHVLTKTAPVGKRTSSIIHLKGPPAGGGRQKRSEEHTSELQSR